MYASKIASAVPSTASLFSLGESSFVFSPLSEFAEFVESEELELEELFEELLFEFELLFPLFEFPELFFPLPPPFSFPLSDGMSLFGVIKSLSTSSLLALPVER